MFLPHLVVPGRLVLPIREKLCLPDQPLVVACRLGGEDRRLIFGLLPPLVEYVRRLQGFFVELLEAAAFPEQAVQFLKLRQCLGGGEVKDVHLHRGDESVVPCPVCKTGIGKPDHLGTSLADGTDEVVCEETEQFRVEQCLSLIVRHPVDNPVLHRVVTEADAGFAIGRPGLRGSCEKIPKTEEPVPIVVPDGGRFPFRVVRIILFRRQHELGVLLFPCDGLVAFRLRYVVFLVQVALRDGQDVGEQDGFLHGNLLRLVQELEPAATGRIPPFL